MGPIHPPSSKGHRFILAIIDYFSKWAEAIPLREVKATDIVKFIKHYVIYRYGVPRRIVHDNGPQFISTVSLGSVTSLGSRVYPRPLTTLPEWTRGGLQQNHRENPQEVRLQKPTRLGRETR